MSFSGMWSFMKRHVKHFLLFLLLLTLFSHCSAVGEIQWPASPTDGQAALRGYIEQVNADLEQLGEYPINRMFELYASGGTFGITWQEDAEIPEGVELTFTLHPNSIDSLILRVSDSQRFSKIAGACLHALSPETTALKDAAREPEKRAANAIKKPQDSFEDHVITLNGTSPRVYYAYYPNQYRDGTSWLQMTLIFPIPGAEGSPILTTEPPPTVKETEYEGYQAYDDNNHFEVFATATPEPDSPASSKWDLPMR